MTEHQPPSTQMGDRVTENQVSGDTCLLIDNDETRLAIEAEMLAGMGYRVISVRDELEAMNLFKLDPDAIGLVVLGMALPSMGGDEFVQQLIDLKPGVQVVLSPIPEDGAGHAGAERRTGESTLHQSLSMLQMVLLVKSVNQYCM